MLPPERHNEILKHLETVGSVNVKALAEALEVTSETVRRDLDLLDRQGKLLRIHGGAVKHPEQEKETPYYTRKITNIDLKKELAVMAVSLIQPGDQIILDASSTAWFMAQELPNFPITVLTNSLLIASELASKENVNLICTGGALLRTSQAFVGHVAVGVLGNYHVNKAFISATGVHPVWGLSEPNENAVLVKRKMIEIADTVYALMDSTKFGVQDLVQICTLDKVDHVVTNNGDGPKNAALLQQAAGKVLY